MIDNVVSLKRPSYVRGRQSFLQAAERRKAKIVSYPHGLRGRHDEELATDVCYVGPEEPEKLLVISTAVHGVEGYAGCAILTQLFAEQLDGLDLPPDVGILGINFVSPYGASFASRADIGNINLNRNFLKHPDDHIENPEYAEISWLINPVNLDHSWADGFRFFTKYRKKWGNRKVQEVLTRGQYVDERGVEFGGFEESPTNALFRRILRENIPPSVRACTCFDVHTGLGGEKDDLGAHSGVVLITEFPEDSYHFRQGRRWFGKVVQSSLSNSAISTPRLGTVDHAIVQEIGKVNPACAVAAYCAEFETYDLKRVAWTCRSDNWLNNHGELESGRGQRIKKNMYRMFFPPTKQWRANLLKEGALLVDQAVRGLAAVDEG